MAHAPDRRSFLKRALAGAALIQGSTLFPSSLGAAEGPDARSPLPTDAPRDEEFWRLFRSQFAFTEARVPMNAANLCPSPRLVADAVSEMTRDIDVDCSFQNRSKFDGTLEGSRAAVAGYLGVTPDEIALVRNTSEANNIVNAGLPLEPGDEVVIWDQNHPTNAVAWDVRSARYGIRVRRVSTPENPSSAEELAAPFLAAFNNRTRVVAFSHVSNVSGIRLPARLIADAGHARGIHVHVDGAQSFGAERVDLRALGCDTYTASSHKWFMGPKEAGVLYVREDRIPAIWPSVIAPSWGREVEPDVDGARKFESLGQRDDACLAAMGITVDLHAQLGFDEVGARMTQLATALKEGIAELGIPLVTPMDPALSGGVVIVRVAGDGRPLFERMYSEFGIAGAPTGGLRLSPHVYNTMEHIERALAALTAMRGEIVPA